MARTPKDVHVVLKVDRHALDDALAKLRKAEAEYLDLLSGARDCPSNWPADPPGEGYLGTRCQKLRHHDGRHRHRMLGSQVVVEWD